MNKFYCLFSSDLNIYEQTLRPTLTIVWGNP